jgi:hypothetical protein
MTFLCLLIGDITLELSIGASNLCFGLLISGSFISSALPEGLRKLALLFCCISGDKLVWRVRNSLRAVGVLL